MAVQGRETDETPQRRTGNRAAAPGPYLGYSLQPVRLCYYLLTAEPSSSVSIEHLDDVAVHAADSTLLEQTKSATGQNPISDWSPELWKTFANWIDAIQNDQVNVEKTQFRLYVTPPHCGDLAQRLNDASTDEAADQAIERIVEELASLPKKPASHRYLKKLLDLDHVKRRTLIKHFQLESAHNDPVDAIRKYVRVTVSAAMVDTCCKYAIGRAKEEADRLIRAGATPLIHAGDFQTAFIAFVHKHDLSGLLTSIAPLPSDELVEQTLALAPPFVRQLDLVEMPSDLLLRAVSDYLQASVNKTHWAEAGQIVRESLAELDDSLVREHGLIQLELEETQSAMDPKGRGRLLYARCGHSKQKLEGREVPAHFIPGCFNDLADRLRLGWHPQYKHLLATQETSGA